MKFHMVVWIFKLIISILILSVTFIETREITAVILTAWEKKIFFNVGMRWDVYESI